MQVDLTAEREYIRAARHRARTDILWLAREVLGTGIGDKLCEHVHGPMTQHLTRFDKQGTDVWDDEKGRWVYTPPDPDPLKVYPEDRKRRLLLAPRSWFKTSLNVIAHTVQWILNFPDITILLMHGSQDTVEKMLSTIKLQFMVNNRLRYLFPEFCPPVGAKEFGTQVWFNTPARRRWTTAPTVSCAGIDSVRTGMHYHVIKFTDIVDEKNTATKDQCEKNIRNYGMCRNLLISPLYWIDIEGTRYNFSDLYGKVTDEWMARFRDGREQEFQVFHMGCYKVDVGVLGKAKEEFTPDEIEAPFITTLGRRVRDLKLLKDGELPISRFPEEWPADALEAIRRDPIAGEYLFATQQLNNPVATEDQQFPLKLLQWKTPEEINRIPGVYALTSVDLAETVTKRADYTVITTALVDRFNRKYVVDIQRGRWKPDEIVTKLFQTYHKYRPYKVKIEKTGFLRGLENSIQRRSQMEGVYLPLEFIQRDTQTSKIERIALTLQPMFVGGLLYFSTALDADVKEQLKYELSRFPRYVHDDILDTLADLYQNEPVNGPVRPNRSMEELLAHAKRTMIRRLNEYDEIFGDVTPQSNSWTGLGSL